MQTWGLAFLVSLWLHVAENPALLAANFPQPEKVSPGIRTIPTLTNAIQILRLRPEQAQANPLVQIQGVVTCYDHGQVLFVQDETGGVFVYHTGDRLSLRAGHAVRVSGKAERGRHSPIIISPVFELVDSGPTVIPKPVSHAQIQYGGLDAQWVELEGVVRSQQTYDNRLLLDVADPPHRTQVWIARGGGDAETNLVGSLARIRGVVVARVDLGGKIEAFQVYVNSIADLKILHSPTDEPAAKVHAIAELTGRDLRLLRPERVRVRGTVTLSRPGVGVFVQDNTGGVEILCPKPPESLIVGTVVEATGYPSPILESLRLEDAQLRILANDSPAQPVSVPPEEVFQRRNNNRLIEITARFLGRVATSNSVGLAVQASGRLLTAQVIAPEPETILNGLKADCTLSLTGIARFDSGPDGNFPDTLLLRSSADVKVIGLPAAAHGYLLPTLATFAVLAGIGLVVALVIIQQQHQRTEYLRELQTALTKRMEQSELELRRSVEARERIGRDLHDDIIQSIYAAGLGLEDCLRLIRRAPAQAETRLATTIHMLNETIGAVRNFISGLEPKALTGTEFKAALKSLALLGGESSAPVKFEVDSASVSCLTSTQATHFLHIAKEAISNSLRHARASQILVSLQTVDTGIRLSIQDDGVGFDPKEVAGPGQGLRNLATRASAAGTDLQIISSPGQGCRIVITVPARNHHDPD